jgi:hypothetical protein
MSTCPKCNGQVWVCENHPDHPWIGDDACRCGGAGMPCPVCNPCDDCDPPKLPPGFVVDDEASRR